MKLLLFLPFLLLSYGVGIMGELLLARLGRMRPSLERGPTLRAALTPLLALALLVVATRRFDAPLAGSLAYLLLFLGLSVAVAALHLLLRRPTAWPTLLLLALTLALTAEVCLFSSRAWQSLTYTPYELDLTNEPDTHDFSLTLPDLPLGNLYLPVDESAPPFTVEIAYTDAANAHPSKTYSRTVYPSLPESTYLPLHAAGTSSLLTLSFSESIDLLGIESVTLNAPRPFTLSPVRLAALFAAALLLLGLRKNSPLGRLAYDPEDRRQALLTLIPLALCLLGVTCLIAANERFADPPAGHHAQFAELARSFTEGKLYLPHKVPAWLEALENPYDTVARELAAREAGGSYYWDAAYFDGHYYVYFGVVPTLLLYLPYHLITGGDLSNSIAVLLFAYLLVVGLFAAVRGLLARFSSPGRLSFAEYLLLTLAALAGCGIVFLGAYPDLYSVPIIAGLAFSSLGIAAWTRASAHEEKDPRRFAACLGLGSLCLALAVGCRPQFVLLSFAALPLFWDSVFTRRTLLSKRGLTPTLLFCLPYLVVAAGLMWYNLARFGSIADFGAAYNLTTNDVSRRGFSYDRLGTAFFYYLFQPPVLEPIYPFLHRTWVQTTYIGLTISQDIYGGLLFVAPLTGFLFAAPALRRDEKRTRALPTALTLAAVTLLFVAIDAQMGGILARYLCDMALPALLGAVIAYVALRERSEAPRPLLMPLTLLGVVYAALFALTVIPIEQVYSLLFWM